MSKPEISVNQFILADLNLDAFDYPTPVVKTWSSMFRSGGSVALEVEVAGRRIVLAEIAVDRDGPVTYERAALNELRDEFIEDLHGNWDRLITDALKSVIEYRAKQAAEGKQVRAKLERFETKALAR